MQHFWYFVAVTYTWGARLAHLIACYHEWNAPGLLRLLPASGMGYGSAQDLTLSSRATVLGRMPARESIRPAEVGNCIRHALPLRKGCGGAALLEPEHFAVGEQDSPVAALLGELYPQDL